MAEEVKKSRLFLERKPLHKDAFVFVTHIPEHGNAHLEHNPVSGKYQEKDCDCKKEVAE